MTLSETIHHFIEFADFAELELRLIDQIPLNGVILVQTSQCDFPTFWDRLENN